MGGDLLYFEQLYEKNEHVYFQTTKPLRTKTNQTGIYNPQVFLINMVWGDLCPQSSSCDCWNCGWKYFRLDGCYFHSFNMAAVRRTQTKKQVPVLTQRREMTSVRRFFLLQNLSPTLDLLENISNKLSTVFLYYSLKHHNFVHSASLVISGIARIDYFDSSLESILTWHHTFALRSITHAHSWSLMLDSAGQHKYC